jgi:flagellar basal-body rod protein FlgB
MLDALNRALDFQATALTLRSERSRVLAGNLANADTPNFKARDFDFGQALAQAAGNAPLRAAARTHAAHLPAAPAAAAPTLLYRAPLQSSLDGNTVEMDVERARFADNTLRYEASLRFLNGQIRTLMTAMGAAGQGQ